MKFYKLASSIIINAAHIEKINLLDDSICIEYDKDKTFTFRKKSHAESRELFDSIADTLDAITLE